MHLHMSSDRHWHNAKYIVKSDNSQPEPAIAELGDKAQAVQPNIKDEQRIHCQSNPVLHHSTPTQYADSRGQGPET